ncbi:hypothetical protein H4R24_002564 [Coemansia sp. RSA 988]|nr:hypothetical protein H4R24_002564 [Coemansia sp. RSA 988]
MLQRRGLCSPLTRLALCNVVPTRLLNAKAVWHISRLYASAAKDTASDQHQDLITKIRAYQKEDVTIPWYALAAQYRLSYDSMEQILAQDDARIREQKELSVRITQRADQLYDENRGCCDWDTVANEFDKPLLECLELYDTALSTTVRQSRPNIADWPVETIGMLKTFPTKHADLIAGNNLRLFGIYVNVRDEDCITFHHMVNYPRMTSELYELVKKCREDGMKWEGIHIKYPFMRNLEALSSSYRRFGHESPRKSAKCVRTIWTKSETTRIQEILKEYWKPGDMKSAIQVAIAEFVDRPKNAVISKLRETQNTTYLSPNKNMVEKIRGLVDRHGEDWERIGAEMGFTAKQIRILRRNGEEWLNRTPTWTDGETEVLRRCIKDGVRPADASKLIGTKSLYSCMSKMKTLNNRGRSDTKRIRWNTANDNRLNALVSASYPEATDWAHISKKLGREIGACKKRYYILASKAEYRRPSKHADSIYAEAKRQYEQQSDIDWAQIGQSIGLSELQCLEICRYDEGKAKWAYNLDTFSWDTANKMTAFIRANYPPPAPVNYRAVSNYMWVDANDCARMAMMLRGDMEWTDEIKEKIVKLRKQGVRFEDIARQISPNISVEMVNKWHQEFTAIIY